MRKSHLLSAVALLISTVPFLSGCGNGRSTEFAIPAGSQPGDLVNLEPCEFQPGKKKTYDAECSHLVVRERWDAADSRLISLPVVRIPATGPNPAAPVFWLQGGPGASNLSFSPPDWLLERHDVIEVGYRGVDGSVDLACPKVNELSKSYLGRGIFGEDARGELVDAVRSCAEEHESTGVDLGAYTVSAVIRDMEAARLALGYDRINIYSGSYGTRVAQLYAYLYPESLHRVVMIGLNTPGHFIYDPATFDDMVRHIGDLCQQDPDCSLRTSDLAQMMHDVNRDMPDRWLFFPIDPDTVRFGTQMMFFANPNMALPIDMYLAAGEGDPSGLAMLTLMSKYVFPPFVYGDLFNKAGTLDRDFYGGPNTIALGDSIMGAPLAEFLWPMASVWPLEMEDESVRRLQESDVEMLVVNGTVDFSTPPSALEEARPYWHNAHFVLLPEFSHVADVESLQPAAFERLLTTFYNTGTPDDSLFVYQPISLKPRLSLPAMAKFTVAALVLLPMLLVSGLALIIRRVHRRGTY